MPIESTIAAFALLVWSVTPILFAINVVKESRRKRFRKRIKPLLIHYLPLFLASFCLTGLIHLLNREMSETYSFLRTGLQVTFVILVIPVVLWSGEIILSGIKLLYKNFPHIKHFTGQMVLSVRKFFSNLTIGKCREFLSGILDDPEQKEGGRS